MLRLIKSLLHPLVVWEMNDTLALRIQGRFVVVTAAAACWEWEESGSMNFRRFRRLGRNCGRSGRTWSRTPLPTYIYLMWYSKSAMVSACTRGTPVSFGSSWPGVVGQSEGGLDSTWTSPFSWWEVCFASVESTSQTAWYNSAVSWNHE